MFTDVSWSISQFAIHNKLVQPTNLVEKADAFIGTFNLINLTFISIFQFIYLVCNSSISQFQSILYQLLQVILKLKLLSKIYNLSISLSTTIQTIISLMNKHDANTNSDQHTTTQHTQKHPQLNNQQVNNNDNKQTQHEISTIENKQNMQSISPQSLQLQTKKKQRPQLTVIKNHKSTPKSINKKYLQQKQHQENNLVVDENGKVYWHLSSQVLKKCKQIGRNMNKAYEKFTGQYLPQILQYMLERDQMLQLSRMGIQDQRESIQSRRWESVQIAQGEYCYKQQQQQSRLQRVADYYYDYESQSSQSFSNTPQSTTQQIKFSKFNHKQYNLQNTSKMNYRSQYKQQIGNNNYKGHIGEFNTMLDSININLQRRQLFQGRTLTIPSTIFLKISQELNHYCTQFNLNHDTIHTAHHLFYLFLLKHPQILNIPLSEIKDNYILQCENQQQQQQKLFFTSLIEYIIIGAIFIAAKYHEIYHPWLGEVMDEVNTSLQYNVLAYIEAKMQNQLVLGKHNVASFDLQNKWLRFISVVLGWQENNENKIHSTTRNIFQTSQLPYSIEIPSFILQIGMLNYQLYHQPICKKVATALTMYLVHWHKAKIQQNEIIKFIWEMLHVDMPNYKRLANKYFVTIKYCDDNHINGIKSKYFG